MKTLAAGRVPKIWMNVTASTTWDRPVVGVIRVERELCRELALLCNKEEFGLCVFDGDEFRTFAANEQPPIKFRSTTLAKPRLSQRFPKTATFDPIFRVTRWASKNRARGPSATVAHETPLQKTPGQQITHGDIILSVGLDWNHSYVDTFQHLSDAMGVKIVTCCYDLIPVVKPQYCVGDVAPPFTDYFTKLSWASSLILCISERSRNDYVDLVRKIGARQADTVIIPLGDNVPQEGSGADDDSNLADVSPDVLRVAEEPFILFVSTIERRKNHEVLYRAYHLLAKKGQADRLPKLLFVGMPGWGVDDLLKDIALDPLTKGLIVQLNHVSDIDLGYLYEKAYFCVYPSLYEGWGLPVGEALAYGKAIVASGQGSIPEVGGNLVTYLDPWNARAWANEILALTNEPDRVKSMEDAVRHGYRVRTWRDTAAVVKTALDRLREPSDLLIILYPGYDLQSMTGTACGEAMHSTGAAGSLTHGPFRVLPAGSYEVEIVVDKLEGSSGRLLCSLRSTNGTKEHGTLEIDFDEREHFNLVAKMDVVRLNTQINDYEIYSEVTANLLLSLNQVNINEVS